jgi:hypothetical protein
LAIIENATMLLIESGFRAIIESRRCQRKNNLVRVDNTRTHQKWQENAQSLSQRALRYSPLSRLLSAQL